MITMSKFDTLSKGSVTYQSRGNSPVVPPETRFSPETDKKTKDHCHRCQHEGGYGNYINLGTLIGLDIIQWQRAHINRSHD